MAVVPNVFQNATGSIPLSQLDDNFTGIVSEVTTIAGLRLLLKTGSPRAIVSGYYSQGDGGGGLYYYDSSDTTSADNGGTIIVAADGGRWKLVQSGPVTVDQFGAKGDWNGATGTDDYNAINASLTAIGYALLTSKRYKIGTGLTCYSKSIKGRGVNFSELYYSGAGTALQCGGSDTTPCNLEGFRLTGTASATAGLLISQAGTGCRRGRFIDLYISGFTKVGVWGFSISASLNNGVYYNRFERINVIGNDNGARVYSSDGAINGYRANSNTFDSCDFSSNVGDGLFIEYAVGNTFTGCNREVNGGYGVNLSYSYGTNFEGGYSEGNTLGALFKSVNAIRVMWEEGRIIDSLTGTTNSTGDVFFTDNTIIDASGNLNFAGTAKFGGGLGLNGANPLSNTLNFANATAAIAISGANRIIISTVGSYFGGTGYITNNGVPLLINNQNAGVHAGANTPEGAVNGFVGSLFLRTNGGAATSLYVKESGSGNTGWVAK